MLAEEILKHYRKAGRIASQTRQEIPSIVKEGASLLQICEKVESSIREKGGKPAFPCNVCINDVAAHYSSPLNDTRTIPKDAVVKVDLGVQIDGYVADTAITLSLSSRYDGMVYAVNEALEQAIKTIEPKVKISTIGGIVQKTIERYGFKPIRNLSGHQMTRYVLHTGKSIPNVASFGFQSIKEGEVYAIEPFLTQASGWGEVRSGTDAYIYRFQKKRRVNNIVAAKLLSTIQSDYKSLPFSPRWIKGMGDQSIRNAFEELLLRKCLSSYPILIEARGGVVAQAEHTVVITRDGCIVTTR